MNKKTMVERINKKAEEQKKKDPKGFKAMSKPMKSDPYPVGPRKGGK